MGQVKALVQFQGMLEYKMGQQNIRNVIIESIRKKNYDDVRSELQSIFVCFFLVIDVD